MALFRRKNNQVSSDPYYSNQQSNKPMAWLLAVVTFVVTLLIILALFFAGRWVWRHTFGDNSSGTESTTKTGEGTENSPTIDGNVPDNSDSSATQGDQTGIENQTQQGGSAQGGATQGSSTQGSNSSQTSSSSTSVPSTTSQPNTGPTENMLAVFVITSVLGFIVHKKWLTKQS